MRGTNDAKRELRRNMRAVRAEASVDHHRSVAIVERLVATPELATARVVMAFDPVPGEPDLRDLARRLPEATVIVPEADPAAAFPIAPHRIDAVVVPGLAFTRTGARLGQGGGWYDRFLAGLEPTCATIGVCFDEQLVDDLPAEPHDVPVAMVVTPTTSIRVAAAS